MSDYILREDAIEAHCMNCQCIDQEDDKSACWCMGKDRINQIPAADVRPVVRGEWLEPDDDYGYLECSVCEESSPNDERWNFCPNCGADMRKQKKVGIN